MDLASFTSVIQLPRVIREGCAGSNDKFNPNLPVNETGQQITHTPTGAACPQVAPALSCPASAAIPHPAVAVPVASASQSALSKENKFKKCLNCQTKLNEERYHLHTLYRQPPSRDNTYTLYSCPNPDCKGQQYYSDLNNCGKDIVTKCQRAKSKPFDTQPGPLTK